MTFSAILLAEAAALIGNGKVCAFPTETVYGLGADATNADAVLRIYETKGRPRFNPLIVHCADLPMARQVAVFDATAELLARFWPGPLTLVLPSRVGNQISTLVTAGLATVGIRIPAHLLARELIAAVGRPLAAPSANPSGRLSPTTAEQVWTGFGGRVPVLDGGPCMAGVESTILTINGARVIQLRAGALARGEIEAVLGRPVELAAANAEIAAPGMLASHYAPRAMLRLDVQSPHPGELLLGFGTVTGAARNLSNSGDLREAARNLFAMLHELDGLTDAIAVSPVPMTGLGEAINDRLRRAASPR